MGFLHHLRPTIRPAGAYLHYLPARPSVSVAPNQWDALLPTLQSSVQCHPARSHRANHATRARPRLALDSPSTAPTLRRNPAHRSGPAIASSIPGFDARYCRNITRGSLAISVHPLSLCLCQRAGAVPSTIFCSFAARSCPHNRERPASSARDTRSVARHPDHGRNRQCACAPQALGRLLFFGRFNLDLHLSLYATIHVTRARQPSLLGSGVFRSVHRRLLGKRVS